jgi:xanthine/CO dehydrogenase XdhC/CoxF family maturation factor
VKTDRLCYSVMANTTKLLESIEDRASLGQVFAIVRVLHSTPAASVTVAVCEDELFPSIEDRKISDHIFAATRGMLASGRVTDLIDFIDEQGSQVRLAFEIVKPKLELIVFGAGHVGQAVGLIAAIMGYDVMVVDDREEFASRARFPDPRIGLMACDYAIAAEKLDISSSAAVVIVTRGHQYDEICLKNAIRSAAGYIGMIGSRKRVLSVFKKLAAEGISERDFEKVYAPIGLRIGARSPQEIAVSILAEIIDHMNNPGKHKGEKDAI